MAFVHQTAALIELAQTFDPGGFVNQTNRRCTLLRMLPIVVGGGKNVAWVAESSGANAEAYADGDDVANTASDAQADAILAWTLLRANSSITGLAEAAAGAVRDPMANANLLAKNVNTSLAALAKLLNGYLFDGNGAASPAQPTGLDSAIGDTTNTYATIVRGSSAYWQPYVVDPGSNTAITQQQIRTDLSTIYTNSGEVPDLAVCTPAVFDAIVAMFDSRQVNVNYLDRVTTARGDVTLSSGYRAINVEGITFVKDVDATAGYIYYLNTNYVAVEVLPKPQVAQAFGFTPGMVMRANDGFGEVPLAASIEALGKTGDNKKYSAMSYVQLVVKRPNACGVRKHVLTA